LPERRGLVSHWIQRSLSLPVSCPWRRRAVSGLVVVLVGVLFAPLHPVAAADLSGSYGVKGAGASSCKDFVNAFDEQSPAMLRNYAGWIDGFVTATNRSTTHVFDIAPWQSTQMLVSALARYCRNSPELSFHRAILAMTQKLEQEGLESASVAIVAKHRGKAVVVYQAVLDDVRKELVGRGFLATTPQGPFDEHTMKALGEFQRDAGIAVTGLPDQFTLVRLFTVP